METLIHEYVLDIEQERDEVIRCYDEAIQDHLTALKVLCERRALLIKRYPKSRNNSDNKNN